MKWYSAYVDVFGEAISSPYGNNKSKYQTAIFKKTIIPHNIQNKKPEIKYIVLLQEIDTGKIIDYVNPFNTEKEATDYAVMMSELQI